MATICASPIFLPEAHVYMARLAYFMRGAYGSYAPQNSFPPIAFSLVVEVHKFDFVLSRADPVEIPKYPHWSVAIAG